MNSLVVAFISTAFASNTGCKTAWDCPNEGEYCYQGNPNYCKLSPDGIGSLCQHDSDCGYLGYDKMYCCYMHCWTQKCTGRRLEDASEEAGKLDLSETDVTEQAPNSNSVKFSKNRIRFLTRRLEEASEEAGKVDLSETDVTELRRGDTTVQAPNPYSNTGCRSSWDCAGVSEYCYEGHPNYCAYGDGVGSLCENSSGCGWLGHGSGARKMYCSGDKCVDPHGPSPDFGRRLDETSELRRPDVSVPNSLDETELRRSGTVQAPNPHSNTGCRDAWDCQGESMYCYYHPHGLPLCRHGDGVGSICMNDGGCGWLGYGDNAREMICRDYTCEDPWSGRRLDTSEEGEELELPTEEADVTEMRRSSTVQSPNPHSNTECRDAWDCDGESMYCYYRPHGPAFCRHGDGVGSKCMNDGGCGWLGYGDNAREMICRNYTCKDPWSGRRLSDLDEAAVQAPEPEL